MPGLAPDRPGDALGLVAGGGSLPRLVAEAARVSGWRVIVVRIGDGMADDWSGYEGGAYPWGRTGDAIAYMKSCGVRRMVFCGTVSHRPDFRSLIPSFQTLIRLPAALKIVRGGDDRLLRALSRYMERQSFEMLAVQDIVPQLLTPGGTLTRRMPDADEEQALVLAARAAGRLGELDIGQAVVASRDRVIARLRELGETEFIGTDIFVHTLDIGPPVGRPVQFRVSGPDTSKVRAYAQQVASIVGDNPNTDRVTFDWNEPARVVKIDIRQDKARQLGVTSSDIASVMNGIVGGSTATQIRDQIYLVDVVSRAISSDRSSIEALENLQIPTRGGQSFPLAAIATFHYEQEQPFLWRRNRIPTLTVKSAISTSVQPATVVAQLEPKLNALRAELPDDYRIETGGAVEESAKSQGPIAAVAPLMLIIMATLLMVQLQSFQRMFLVVAVAPLGLIGVVAALLPSGAPLGFVAILGVLALIGILIRNSVILIVQIEHLISTGEEKWDAVISATEHRMRPIMLTAAAASLALIPISREVFWGPMAYAMMGGIIVGTVLTLLFLPALYVAWFGIKDPRRGKTRRGEVASADQADPASA